MLVLITTYSCVLPRDGLAEVQVNDYENTDAQSAYLNEVRPLYPSLHPMCHAPHPAHSHACGSFSPDASA